MARKQVEQSPFDPGAPLSILEVIVGAVIVSGIAYALYSFVLLTLDMLK